jgi:hypothetical protein
MNVIEKISIKTQRDSRKTPTLNRRLKTTWIITCKNLTTRSETRTNQSSVRSKIQHRRKPGDGREKRKSSAKTDCAHHPERTGTWLSARTKRAATTGQARDMKPSAEIKSWSAANEKRHPARGYWKLAVARSWTRDCARERQPGHGPKTERRS